jgi:bifunctional DNA-binding transcriptional regulator/antitoxin component of YhaV-PrlF toxin-antitoxin module
MGETTQLTKATSRSESLRTTVPAGIVKQFGMKERDALEWRIEIKGSKLIIEIVHVKQKRKAASRKKRSSE